MGKASRRKKARLAHKAEIVQLYSYIAMHTFPKNFTAARCLNASRITMEVMRTFSIRCEPLVTHATAYNEPLQKLMAEHDEVTEEMRDAVGGWAVAVGGEVEGTPGFPAHLVCILDGNTLLDAAAGQFSRPAKNLIVPEVITTPASEPFLKGEAPLICQGPSGDGAILVYWAKPGDESYARVPGWQLSPWNMEMVTKFVETINRLLDDRSLG